MKPIVLVDQDGPLADFDARFFEMCAENGWELHSDRSTQCHRFATDCMVDRKARRKARLFVDSSAWFADLPVVEGAVEGINALAEHAEVWICTKPLEANLTCRDDKAMWVRKNLGVEWERRLIMAPDKSLVIGDVLLDDAPKPEWFVRAPWQPVVFSTPWNGPGSVWGELPHWTWGEDVERLLEKARKKARRKAS